MKKIIFLSGGVNPDSAAFNRFYTVYKMMEAVGFLVSLVCIRPVKKEKTNHHVVFSGNTLIYDDLTYQNVYWYSGRKTFLVKLYLRIKTYKKAISFVSSESKNLNTVLYLNTVDLLDYLVFYFVAKKYRLKYVKERSEYPVLIRHPERIRTWMFKYMVLPWAYKFFDGMVIMTGPLIDFYTKYVRKNCRIVKIPMTVDPDRFTDNQVKDEKYLGYVGGLDCKKDGLDVLIRSFSQIAGDFPDYTLKIAGVPANKGEEEYLQELVKQLGIEQKVKFVGGLSRAEIPDFLLSATMLVLARPASKQAEGGFPTKLGEYLMTGKPVIVTDVGEISAYLKNGEDAFIIKPGDERQLSEKIAFILKHPEIAEKIGKNGRQTALSNFDYNNYVARMRNFIESLD